MPQYLIRAISYQHIIIDAESEEEALDKSEEIDLSDWEGTDIDIEIELHEPEESSF